MATVTITTKKEKECGRETNLQPTSVPVAQPFYFPEIQIFSKFQFCLVHFNEL
jgi:hypothetical protein